jgi:hypothetical protein
MRLNRNRSCKDVKVALETEGIPFRGDRPSLDRGGTISLGPGSGAPSICAFRARQS